MIILHSTSEPLESMQAEDTRNVQKYEVKKNSNSYVLFINITL